MLTTLSVEHFKSLADVNVSLRPSTIFVGRNSVGKSNIIETLLFLRDCADRGPDSATSDRYGIDSILQWSRYRPFNLSIRANYSDETGSGYYQIKISSRKKQPFVISEHGSWSSVDLKEYSAFSREESGKLKLIGVPAEVERSIINRPLEEDETALGRLRLFYFPGSNGFGRIYRWVTSMESYSIYPNVIRAPQKPSRDAVLSSTGDNLTSILKTMASSKAARIRRNYNEIVRTMKTIIPNLERIIVRNLSGLLWLAFEVSEFDGSSHQLNTTQISDGALRILGILVALYQPHPPRILAVEEPEQNLHPGALGVLADAFKDTANNTQLLITTHSPHLLDHFDVDDIRNVHTKEALTCVSKLSQHQRDTVKNGLLSAGELLTSQGLIPGTQ